MANMSKKPRPYKVVEPNGTVRLVSGHNQAQVARYLAKSYQITPASAMEVISLIGGGIKVESACGKEA